MAKKSVDDIPRHARTDMVAIASAISSFEGGEPSHFYSVGRAKFVNGEINADKLHERVVEYRLRQA
jgi:hypothetical protein